MKKKKYNFNNIKEMYDKKIKDPQERIIIIDKKNANKIKPKNAQKRKTLLPQLWWFQPLQKDSQKKRAGDNQRSNSA